MRALIQRVRKARVMVDGAEVGSCGCGLLILLGVGEDDTELEAKRLWQKISRLRIFADEHGKTNLSLADVGGEVLVVSQFTLYADCRRGNRPSFAHAAPPELGESLYERFCLLAKADVSHVGMGVFGADMQVELVNDGPFTVWIDTTELARPRK